MFLNPQPIHLRKLDPEPVKNIIERMFQFHHTNKEYPILDGKLSVFYDLIAP